MTRTCASTPNRKSRSRCGSSFPPGAARQAAEREGIDSLFRRPANGDSTSYSAEKVSCLPLSALGHLPQPKTEVGGTNQGQTNLSPGPKVQNQGKAGRGQPVCPRFLQAARSAAWPVAG